VELRMSFVLQRHQQRVIDAIVECRSVIDEIEGHIRLRAMSNDASAAELALLKRLKEEMTQSLYRYENLKEAFKAILGNLSIAAE
jgi:hypothetical protein